MELNMRNVISHFFISFFILFLTCCTTKSYVHSFCLLNYTDETLSISNSIKTSVVNKGEAYVIVDIAIYEDQDANLSNIYLSSYKPITITMNDVSYQINEYQQDGCGYAEAFSDPTPEERSLLADKVFPNSSIHVFRLTEEYIQSQIVVNE